LALTIGFSNEKLLMTLTRAILVEWWRQMPDQRGHKKNLGGGKRVRERREEGEEERERNSLVELAESLEEKWGSG
jgi:hypothetical protein